MKRIMNSILFVLVVASALFLWAGCPGNSKPTPAPVQERRYETKPVVTQEMLYNYFYK